MARRELPPQFSGGSVGGGLGEWLTVGTRLAADRRTRRGVNTPAGLPGMFVYWLSTVVVLARRRSLLSSRVVAWRRAAAADGIDCASDRRPTLDKRGRAMSHRSW